MALAGCMAIDVADIVIKGRHRLKRARSAGSSASAATIRRGTSSTSRCISCWPATVPAHAIQRAIDLSREKYCSVWHSLRQDITLDTTFEVASCSVRSISTGCAASR